MKNKTYQNISKQLDEAAKKIMKAKQPEYTNKNEDVLHNFKSSAKMLGLLPMEVWAVFFHKHVQAILSHAHNPEMHEAEPIQSRYCDAINYLHLGYALTLEKKSTNGNNKNRIKNS
jgi:hypothetical protein